MQCGGCGIDVPSRLTVCPSCGTLVHRVRLEAIASEAQQAAGELEFAREASLWREALLLLPKGSKQHDAVGARVTEAAAKIQSEKHSKWTKAGPLGIAGIAILSKAKLLLLGLTKLTTVLSMLAFLGVYWKMWGFPFALAIVATIYIHEIGHVAQLKRFGMTAHAPMFIPGFGAFVRMQDAPATPREDARIGLAGPVWGLSAAIVALAVAVATRSAFWQAVAHTTAFINLFNLTPVWQLDGSRGFSALARLQRWLIVAAIALAWLLSREGILIIVALVAIWRAVGRDAPASNDWGAFMRYALLLGALSWIVTFPPIH
jgi:Zn-dependent protease